MQTLPTTKLKKRLTEGLVGLAVLLGLLAPLSFAEAQTPPGLPAYKTGYDWVFIYPAGVFHYYESKTDCTIAYNSLAPAIPPSNCLYIVPNGNGKQIDLNLTVMEKVAVKAGNTLGDIGDLLLDVLLSPLTGLSWLLNWMGNTFMEGMGYLLDVSIAYTLNSSMYTGVSAIQVGWTIVRDFTNMFFIFILLYISILTVVGEAGANAKRWVASLIIAALLINFSLFFTSIVIDAGNILALGFWNKMTVQQGNITGNSAVAHFMEGFRIQTQFDTKDASGNDIELNSTKKIVIYLGGAAVAFVAGYVFLAGAIMMIVRSVTLMILMIISPFAFLGFALPKGGGFASQWWGRLVGSSFMAPAFVFMLYIDMLIIKGAELIKSSGADKAKMAAAMSGSVADFSIFYNFALMIILLLAALKVAHEVGGKTAEGAGKWAKTAIGVGGGATIAGGAMFGRQTFGALGRNKLQDEKWVKEQNRLIAKGGMSGTLANMKLATMQKASKGTWDLRNATVMGGGVNTLLAKTGTGVNLGAGGKKSFETGGQVLSSITKGYRGTDDEKKILEKAKENYKGDAINGEAFLKNKLGNEYDSKRHKDLRKEVNSEIEKAQRVNKLEAETQQNEHLYGDIQKEQSALTQLTADLAKETPGTQAHDAIMKAIDAKKIQILTIESDLDKYEKSIASNIQGLSSEKIADLAAEKPALYDSKAFRNGLSSSDLVEINKRTQSGAYSGASFGARKLNAQDMLKELSEEKLRNPNTTPAEKKTIRDGMRNGTWAHQVDTPKQITNILSTGRNPDGSYISRTTPLSANEQAQFDDAYNMSDNTDIADIHPSLYANPAILSKAGPKTLVAIDTKLRDDGVSDTDINNIVSGIINLKPNPADQKSVKRVQALQNQLARLGKQADSIFYQKVTAPASASGNSTQNNNTTPGQTTTKGGTPVIKTFDARAGTTV